MLQRRAGMVDLVEIAGIEECGFLRSQRLLVGQFVPHGPAQRLAGGVIEDEFAKLRNTVRGQAEIARAAGEIKRMPFEQGNVVLVEFGRICPGFPVLREREGKTARTDNRVDHRTGDLVRAVELQRQTLALGKDDRALRSLRVAEVGEGRESVKERDERNGGALAIDPGNTRPGSLRFSAGSLLPLLHFSARRGKDTAVQRREKEIERGNQQRCQGREEEGQFHGSSS